MRVVHRVAAFSLGITFALALTAADKAGRLSGPVLDEDKSGSQITIQQGTAHRVAVLAQRDLIVTFFESKGDSVLYPP